VPENEEIHTGKTLLPGYEVFYAAMVERQTLKSKCINPGTEYF
jgi:hypothetical protein